MRKSILATLAVLLLLVSIFVAKKIAVAGKRPAQEFQKIIKKAYVQNVQNKAIRVNINATGTLVAKNSIDLFSEVQGVLKPSKKEYREGVKYRKGETILAIESDEFVANLRAQKSGFINSLAAIMPDLKLDFPKEFQKWQSYLNRLEVNLPTPALPKVASDKEKFFLTGRSIQTNYYNLKNLETRLQKFKIKAPYDGVLTQTLVNQGTLVRTGQQLGVFMDDTVFELVVNLKETDLYFFQEGSEVRVSNISNTKNWQGKVNRINAVVNSETQTVKIYITVVGEGLKEGMFLNASLQAKEITNAIKLPRALLIGNEQVYIVENELLKLVKINPVHFTDKEVVIQGLQDGIKVLSRTMPGAFDGMQVQSVIENETTK